MFVHITFLCIIVALRALVAIPADNKGDFRTISPLGNNQLRSKEQNVHADQWLSDDICH